MTVKLLLFTPNPLTANMSSSKVRTHTHPKEYVARRVKTGCIDLCYSRVWAVTENATRKPRYRAPQHLALTPLVPWNCVHHNEVNGRLRRPTNLQARTQSKNNDMSSMRATEHGFPCHQVALSWKWGKQWHCFIRTAPWSTKKAVNIKPCDFLTSELDGDWYYLHALATFMSREKLL
jgi:hypothetical protein